MEHEQFLKDLHKRLEIWDAHQRIGDILLEMVCAAKCVKNTVNIPVGFFCFVLIVFQKACDRFVYVVYKQLETSQRSYKIDVQFKTSVR